MSVRGGGFFNFFLVTVWRQSCDKSTVKLSTTVAFCYMSTVDILTVYLSTVYFSTSPLIPLELCVGHKISGAAGKRVRFMQSYGLQWLWTEFLIEMGQTGPKVMGMKGYSIQPTLRLCIFQNHYYQKIKHCKKESPTLQWTFLDFHMETPCGNPKMSIVDRSPSESYRYHIMIEHPQISQ